MTKEVSTLKIDDKNFQYGDSTKLHHYLVKHDEKTLTNSEKTQFGKLLYKQIKFFVNVSTTTGLKIPNSYTKITLSNIYHQDKDDIIQRSLEKILTREKVAKNNPGHTLANLECLTAISILDHTYTEIFHEPTTHEKIKSSHKKGHIKIEIPTQETMCNIKDYKDKLIINIDYTTPHDTEIIVQLLYLSKDLTEQKQTIFYRHILNGESRIDLAKSYGISASGVGIHLLDVKNELNKLYQQEYK